MCYISFQIMDWYIAQDPQFLKIERNKARELRQSQWWKNQLAKGVCYYCGERFHPRELTMDHRVPIARGGKSTKSNVVPSCKACNTEKQSQILGQNALQKISEDSGS
jgi:5-methylcytosine-specific restriction enzyme A